MIARRAEKDGCPLHGQSTDERQPAPAPSIAATFCLLTHTGDVDLNRKLAAWEEFYNLNRPRKSHGGKTPYEALRSMLQ